MDIYTDSDLLAKHRLAAVPPGQLLRTLNALTKSTKDLTNILQSPIQQHVMSQFKDWEMCLGDAEIATKIANLTILANAKDLKSYARDEETVMKTHASTLLHIEEAKIRLETARKLRENRREWDSIAYKILSLPSRTDGKSSVEKLMKQEVRLKREEQVLLEKLEIRRKQVKTLLTFAHQLRDSVLPEVETSLEDDIDIHEDSDSGHDDDMDIQPFDNVDNVDNADNLDVDDAREHRQEGEEGEVLDDDMQE
jgi:THO complex subunit 7